MSPIRVSELRFITIEVVRAGEATVSLKGKTRTVLLVKGLQKKSSDISVKSVAELKEDSKKARDYRRNLENAKSELDSLIAEAEHLSGIAVDESVRNALASRFFDIATVTRMRYQKSFWSDACCSCLRACMQQFPLHTEITYTFSPQ